MNGGRLAIDLDSGRAVMDGGGPPGTTSQGGRVTGTFTVPPAQGRLTAFTGSAERSGARLSFVHA